MPTTSGDPSGRDVLRWYTRARRIPRLVGKLPGSERGIPGGPYTMTQAVGAVSVALLLLKTEALWGQFGWISNKVILLVVTVGTTLALRMVKPGGRDPVSALTALLSVALGSRHGQLRGRQLRARRPVQVRARVRVVPVTSSTGESTTDRSITRPVLEAAPEPGSVVDHTPVRAPVLVPDLHRPPSRPIAGLGGALPRTNLERLLLAASTQEA